MCLLLNIQKMFPFKYVIIIFIYCVPIVVIQASQRLADSVLILDTRILDICTIG